MRARIADKANLLTLVDLLREEYEVIAPFYGRGRDTCFDTVTDANRHLVQLHIPNPYYPPKRFVLPQIEQLLKIHLNEHPRIQPSYDIPRRAVFRVRSCDIAGIDLRISQEAFLFWSLLIPANPSNKLHDILY